MKNTLKTAAISIIFLSTSAFSQVLWQKAETGMTVAQVSNIYPDAIKQVQSEANSYAGGRYGLLKIPNYHIGKVDYEIDFIFKNEKLETVRLLSKEKFADNAVDNAKELLSTKYGTPFNIAHTSISDEVMWKGNGTLIKLSKFTIHEPLVIITYNDEELSDANKF